MRQRHGKPHYYYKERFWKVSQGLP
jgi:hypothetical protein